MSNPTTDHIHGLRVGIPPGSEDWIGYCEYTCQSSIFGQLSNAPSVNSSTDHEYVRDYASIIIPVYQDLYFLSLDLIFPFSACICSNWTLH